MAVRKVIQNRCARIEQYLAALEPPKRTWRGSKSKRVLAYLRGIANKSKHVWTWVNPRKIAACLSKNSEQTVSEKTVWRVLKSLAESEQTLDHDPRLCVRVCQRKTKTNYHFQWLIANWQNLAYDKEPLFNRADGKSRNLRLRCRKKNLTGTRTICPHIVYQQKRESSPPGPLSPIPPPPAAPDNSWKKLVPTVEQIFHRLGIPTYRRGEAIWTHSPWKRDADKTPSCQIFPEEGRFWDYSTAQGGNAVTLARIFNPDRSMSFKEALYWLKDQHPKLAEPSPWFVSGNNSASRDPFAQMLENLKIGGGLKLPSPPRPNGLYRLAWQIYRTKFSGVIVTHLTPVGVVALIVKALARNAERAAVEEAIEWALLRYKENASFFEGHCKSNFRSLCKKQWRRGDLRNAQEPEHFGDMFSLARFLNDLRRALDRAFLPAKSSPGVERNTDPDAIKMCQAQIREMFRSNESIWITNSLRHRGWCRTAEYWLDDMGKNGVPTGPDGAWLKLNPMSQFGIGNEDVHEFRHVLCEADSISIADQMKLLEKLPFPVVSAVHSGGKSVHLVVKVNASKDSYSGIVGDLHEQFPQFDKACRDPARWTRLAGACRAGVLQTSMPVVPHSITSNSV